MPLGGALTRSPSLRAPWGLAEGRCLPHIIPREPGPPGGARWSRMQHGARTHHRGAFGCRMSVGRLKGCRMDPGHVECLRGGMGWVQGFASMWGGSGRCRMGPGDRGGSWGTAWVQGTWGSPGAGWLQVPGVHWEGKGWVWVVGGCSKNPGVSQPCAWGAGLPGAGVRGAGRGDRVPAGPPGESPHVSHTLWQGEGGSHTMSPATYPVGPLPAHPLQLGTLATLPSASRGAQAPTPPPALVPKLTQHLWPQGDPGEAVWDHPAAGRGAQ